MLLTEIESWMDDVMRHPEIAKSYISSRGATLLLRLRSLRSGQVGKRQERRRTDMAILRTQVLNRANGSCEFCGADRKLQLHHLLGGSGRRRQQQSERTCAAVCSICHNAYHAAPAYRTKQLWEWSNRTGFPIPKWATR